MKSSILFTILKKRGRGEKWESITNTAEFADPADVIFFKRG